MSFLGFEIAKSGMNTAKQQLQVTAHNIANINTPGYTRQIANQVTRNPIHSFGKLDSVGTGILGTGTEIQSIQRARNEFLDSEYRSYLAITNYSYHMSQGMKQIEKILNEPSDVALSANMNTFWNSLSELSSKVADLSARATFVQSALSFTTALNTMGDKIDALKSQYKQELDSAVAKVNDLTNHIYDLNLKIADMEALNNPANDLRDERDLLLDELSKLVDIETYTDEGGGVSVLAGGKLLVGINTKRQIKLEADGAGSFKVLWSEELDQFEMKGGHLKANLDIMNNSLSDFENDLNNMITSLANRFNEMHKNGFDLNGNAGLEFFISSDGEPLSIHNITINPEIIKNEALLALSSDATLAGDNTNLTKLLAIKDEKLINTQVGNVMSLGEFYNHCVSKIGLQSNSHTTAYENSYTALTAVDTERMSVSGVSMDEETANVMRFQQIYNANAKVLKTVDEMLATLIDLV